MCCLFLLSVSCCLRMEKRNVSEACWERNRFVGKLTPGTLRPFKTVSSDKLVFTSFTKHLANWRDKKKYTVACCDHHFSWWTTYNKSLPYVSLHKTRCWRSLLCDLLLFDLVSLLNPFNTFQPFIWCTKPVLTKSSYKCLLWDVVRKPYVCQIKTKWLNIFQQIDCTMQLSFYILVVQQKYVRPLLGRIIGCVQHDYV